MISANLCDMNSHLMIGGNGFIGKAIASKNAGKIFETDGGQNFFKKDILEKSMAGTIGIFHCGGKSSIPESFKIPDEYQRINVDGSRAIIEAADKLGIKIVFSSSVSVYGPQSRNVTEDSSLDPKSPYAENKIEVETLLKKTKTPSVILRYSNVYGPGQAAHSSIVANFVDKAIKGEDLTIFGDGNQLCDFIHVDDVARANILAMNLKNASCEIFNITSGIQTSANEIAEKILALTKSTSKIVHLPARPSDTTYPHIDISKAAHVLGWKPAISLEDGLRQTIDATK